jgi:hypothetical protein
MAGAAELRPQDIAGGLLIMTAPWIIRDPKPVKTPVKVPAKDAGAAT